MKTIIAAAAFVIALPVCAQAQHAPAQYTAQDSLIFEQTVARARAERIDTLPIGEVVARVGQWFVGRPYTPFTLEQPGPERLVINLREFDCVTFVENMLSLARVIRAHQSDFASFRKQLAQLRYREGRIDGYASRLHYFSDWIADNDAKRIVHNETPDLGVVDSEPINFMTSHRAAYRALADSTVLTQIEGMERRLTALPRYMVPEQQIASIESRIHDGDVIAATSSLPGLDVAHTGIAFWRDGRLHLMHAPLVGTTVEISAVPLADRILAIAKQDGIMVARPLEPPAR